MGDAQAWLPGAQGRSRRKFCFSGNGPLLCQQPLCAALSVPPRPPRPVAGPHLGLRRDGTPPAPHQLAAPRGVELQPPPWEGSGVEMRRGWTGKWGE